MSGSGRAFWFGIALLVVSLPQIARGEGNYQSTRNGKTLVWNADPKSGDTATWSGARDRDGYARGFGTLIWYTREAGKPQLYARYWGNMVRGKFNGPVNVHSKKKTHHAIFAEGERLTRWTPGRARSRMTPREIALVEKRNATVSIGEPEPQPPAEGPVEQRAENRGQQSEAENRIQDLWSERWPKIDIDESLRMLVFPPPSLRR